MARLLIVYGSAAGHTRRIAERIAGIAGAGGHTAEVAECAYAPDLAPGRYDAVAVAAPVYRHRHLAGVAPWVRRNLRPLRAMPNAFFSVSLAAALPDRASQAWACVDGFTRDTGWRPGMAWLVGGALPLTRCGPVRRLLLRWLARRQGIRLDTGVDPVLTDWAQLEREVQLFLRVAARPVNPPRRVALPAAALAQG